MNIRQQKYKKNRISGMNMFNAARAAGYSIYTAKKANRLEKNIADLKDYLEQVGLTDLKLSKLLSQALEARKVIGYLHNYKKGEKGVESISPDEVVSNEFIEIEDWPTRLKAAELILKIKGELKDKVEHSGLGDTNIHIHPNKVLIFKDANGSLAGTDDLYVPEGTEGNRLEGKI